MPYPRELLNDDEELCLDLRPHWWYFARHIFGGFILLAVAVLLAFLPDGSSAKGATISDSLLHLINKYQTLVWLIAFVVWLLFFGIQYLSWIFTLFVVTSDRIIFRNGIIAKRGVEIPLERVNNINFGQTIFERLIGAGTLEIESAGQDGQSTFKNVRHPDAVQQEIYRAMEDNVKKTARYATDGFANQMATGNTQMSIPEQIEKLSQLKDQNIISEAEFLEKRQNLLDQM
jgi:uncharacterized membrane protein YdbT with pleckstrin-like domain